MKIGDDITGENLYIRSCTLLFLLKFGRYLGQNSHRWEIIMPEEGLKTQQSLCVGSEYFSSPLSGPEIQGSLVQDHSAPFCNNCKKKR